MDYTQFLKNKIATDIEEFAPTLAIWRFKNESIVFTNGCFDILHRGHIEYLIKAKSLGSKLVIGLNSDESVRRLKGNGRPVNDEYTRALTLASLIFVDSIIYFEEDTPIKLIEAIQPNILVKGGDYKPEEIVGYDIVKSAKGDVITLDFVDGFSTTSIIEKNK